MTIAKVQHYVPQLQAVVVRTPGAWEYDASGGVVSIRHQRIMGSIFIGSRP